MNITSERLSQYYDFDECVLAVADEIAGVQRSMDWRDFLQYCNMQADPDRSLIQERGTDFVVFRPRGDYDETKARVMFAQMATALKPDFAFQAATVFAYDQTSPLLAIANPGGFDHDANTIKSRDLLKVARGDLLPAVTPTLEMIGRLANERGLERVSYIGASYGSEKAVAAARYANDYDHKPEGVTALEPPAVVRRSLPRLAKAFFDCGGHLQEARDSSNSPAFSQAVAESGNTLGYVLGLARASNIASSLYIARGEFQRDAEAAMDSNGEMRMTITWGSESELALDGLVAKLTEDLSGQYGPERVKSIRIPSGYHSMTNNIHLQAALVTQANLV